MFKGLKFSKNSLRVLTRYGQAPFWGLLALILTLCSFNIPNLLKEFSLRSWAVMSVPFNRFEENWRALEDYINAANKLSALRQDNQALKVAVGQLSALTQENSELRQALKMAPLVSSAFVTMPIIHSPSSFDSQTLIGLLGVKDGLEIDQVVVAEGGLVGRIIDVASLVSRILLLSDPDSRVPVILESSGQAGMIVGDGTLYPQLLYVQHPAEIESGERVLTSGVGGVFPPNLLVGTIGSIEEGEIRILPQVKYMQLRHVHVIETDQRLQEARAMISRVNKNL